MIEFCNAIQASYERFLKPYLYPYNKTFNGLLPHENSLVTPRIVASQLFPQLCFAKHLDSQDNKNISIQSKHYIILIHGVYFNLSFSAAQCTKLLKI